MQPTLEEIVHGMEPVFIVAPTARNGITLLQRLLNSSGKILVYGENTMFMDRLPTLVNTAHNVDDQSGPGFEASRRRFLAEGSEYWSSSLWPDSRRFFLVLLEAFYKAALLYQESARSDGFSRWGVKNPLNTALMIDRLKVLIPRSRFVFIYRNLFDVARSAKARRFVQTDTDFEDLARQWQTNLIGVLDAACDDILTIRYEELISRPEHHIGRIEGFTGIGGIDRAVMTRRINTFTGAVEDGCSPSGYIEPQPLTEAQRDLLYAHAAVGLERMGYTDEEAMAVVECPQPIVGRTREVTADA